MFGVDETQEVPAWPDQRRNHSLIGCSSPLHAFEIIRGVEIVASNPIMADSADADDQVPVDDLTPEEASRIIHSHRKVRYGKEHFSMAMAHVNREQIFAVS